MALRQTQFPPICLAGFPRSGTTWLGATLAGVQGIRAYHEPFNPVTVPRAGMTAFHYAAADHADEAFDSLVLDAFAGRVEGPHVGMNLAGRYQRHPWLPGRAMVKTVFGILAIERISVLTGSRVVVISRNPLDVAASWHRLGWDPIPHLERLRLQDRLIEDHLAPFSTTIRQADDFWSGFGALWGGAHVALRRTCARNPGWITLSFETLCQNPVSVYGDLFRRLQLPFREEDAERVLRASRTPSIHPFRPTRVASEQVGKWRDEGFDPDGLRRLRDVLSRFEEGTPARPGGEPEVPDTFTPHP